MPEFSYIARNQDGVRIENSISANNLKEASDKLLSDNLSIIKISERDTSFDFMTPFMERFNISMEKIKRVNIFSRIIKSFNFFVWGDV